MESYFIYRADDRYIYNGPTSRVVPLVIVSVLCALGVIALLLLDRPRGTRVLAVGAVATMLWAWGVAQFAYLLPQSLTISKAAAGSETLEEVLIDFVIAALVVLPSLGWLRTLAQRDIVEEKSEVTPSR